MKISIIGAGNVGALAAMRIAQDALGDVVLVDVVAGVACGKAFDMEDSRSLLKGDFRIEGTEDIARIQDSDIVVITAGLARKPGMTREDLLKKNAEIVSGVCGHIKRLASQAIVIVVTNPLDVMTHLALKTLGFPAKRVFGMGLTLDGARFNNLICSELKVNPSDVQAMVVGSHGQEMLPLARFTYVKGVALEELLDEQKVDALITRTKERGKEIVSLLGSGSAYFAPSAAVAELVRCVVKDQKAQAGVSAYLSGQYSVKDVCVGVPCLLGRQGIEKIIELELNAREKDAFIKSAEAIRALTAELK